MALQKVEAGLGEVFKSFLKNLGALGTAIGAGVNKLVKWGVEVSKDPEENEKGEKTFFFKVPNVGESELKVVAKPVEGKENTFDFEFYGKDTKLKRTEDKNVKINNDSDFEHLFKKVMKEEWGDEDMESWERFEKDANASAKVFLKKVNSASGTSIELQKIMCGTDVLPSLDMVQLAIDDPDFVAAIPEEGQAYAITDDGEDLDVAEIEAVPDTNPFIDLLCAAICTRNLFQYLHWNCKDRKFNDLHTYLDEAIDKIQDDIDTWGELSVEKFGYAPNPSSLCCGDEVLEMPGGVEGMEGFAIVKDAINRYADAINCIACNCQDGDVQSLMDDIIRGWKKEANYFIARRLLK